LSIQDGFALEEIAYLRETFYCLGEEAILGNKITEEVKQNICRQYDDGKKMPLYWVEPMEAVEAPALMVGARRFFI
jgi:hypothetical protein